MSSPIPTPPPRLSLDLPDLSITIPQSTSPVMVLARAWSTTRLVTGSPRHMTSRPLPQPPGPPGPPVRQLPRPISVRTLLTPSTLSPLSSLSSEWSRSTTASDLTFTLSPETEGNPAQRGIYTLPNTHLTPLSPAPEGDGEDGHLQDEDSSDAAKAPRGLEQAHVSSGRTEAEQGSRDPEYAPARPSTFAEPPSVDARRRPAPAHLRSDSIDSGLLSILSSTPPLSLHSLGETASRPSSGALSLRSLEYTLPRTAERSSSIHLQLSSALPPRKLVEDRAARAAIFAADRQRKYELAQELRAEWMAQPKTPGPERDGELLRQMIMRGI